MVFNTGPYTNLPDNSILITANMQSERGFPISHQLKSYVASKSRLKLAARAVLSADAGLLVFAGGVIRSPVITIQCNLTCSPCYVEVLLLSQRSGDVCLQLPRIFKLELSSCWDWRPFGHNRHGSKVGRGCCAGWVPVSNTMWPGPRPTSLPSDIFIHPTVWPQL